MRDVLPALALLVAACAEPTDCRTHACVPTAIERPVVAPTNPKPRAAPVAAVRPLPVAPMSAQQAPQARVAAPPRERLLGIAAAGLAQESTEQKAARAVINALAPTVKTHDFTALQRHMSKRLADDLGGKIGQYEARLWRHLDHYPAAVDKGFAISTAAEGADRMQVTLTTGDGDELKPILAREGERWVVDRF